MEGTYAEIRLFAGSFAPVNWDFCHGQIYSISMNSALFSILGATYGGDGRTTFALPDLRSRTPFGAGQGPGLSNYPLGQTGGQENVPLPLIQNMVNTQEADKSLTTLTQNTFQVNTRPPFLALNYIICVAGAFPSRS